MAPSIYDTYLDKNPANYQPLTPLSFLERAAGGWIDENKLFETIRRFDGCECTNHA